MHNHEAFYDRESQIIREEVSHLNYEFNFTDWRDRVLQVGPKKVFVRRKTNLVEFKILEPLEDHRKRKIKGVCRRKLKRYIADNEMIKYRTKYCEYNIDVLNLL